MKTLLIFGANGGTGIEVVKQALEIGYQVTALVRDPARMELSHPNLKIVKANVLQRESFEKELTEKTAIISCLGSGSTKPTKVYSEGLENIIAAMQDAAVERLICISAGGLDVNPKNNFLIRFLTRNVLQKILKEPYKDMHLMETLVKKAQVNYTIIRPPRLTNGELKGKYRMAVNENLENTGSLSRADLAHFIVHHIEDQSIYNSTVNLAY